MLKENAVAPPKQTSSAVDGTVRLTYHCKAVMMQIAGKHDGPQTRVQQRARKQPATGAIYELPSAGVSKRKPRLVTTAPTEAPEQTEKSTMLVPRVANDRSGKHALAPLARANDPKAAFDVEASGGLGGKRAYLEIDLGCDCQLSHISTQGRHPPTRQYPRVHSRRAWHRAVAGAHADRAAETIEEYRGEGLPWWDSVRHGQYEGPFWQVLSLGDKECHPECHPSPRQRWQEELQWVTRYDVWVRQEGERGWRSLGSFRGNEDTTTEVAHSLHTLSVSARYVRFRPTEAVGGGAMRVGIYGCTSAAADGGLEIRRPRHTRRGGGAAQATTSSGPPLVTYVIGEAGRMAFCHHTLKRGGNLSRGCPCCYDAPPSRKARRRAIMLAAVQGCAMADE
eukprot:4561950-Prymnesium_polylepis.1